ncbi:four helix bundle protein [Galbibacter mesophilus]|uniref:four helix bundle protein n=1 Tax=Galbibacter mesophilus TaxID=379069 RepID=UPI00191E2957|nr:four helix bundle protein [Galbibacter mesophilus]MCM5662305.1 four helix bundle protein [Galbibacter mesophilus]
MAGATFEDLEVYKLTIAFTIKVFDLLDGQQLKKEFSVKDQLKRATLSISNNIAEGFERETDKELIRFLYFSKGSAGEVRNILNILKETNYINEDKWLALRSEVTIISKQLSNYIKYVKRRCQTP